MPDSRDDLRSTGESIRRDAERAKGLEIRMAALDPSDPRIEQLSGQIERLAAGLQGKTAAERELTEEVRAARAKA